AGASGAPLPACSSTSTATSLTSQQCPEVLERMQVGVDDAHETAVDQHLQARRLQVAQLRLRDAVHAGELELRLARLREHLHREGLEELHARERGAGERGAVEVRLVLAQQP